VSRVGCGGSWLSDPWSCRAANRGDYAPGSRNLDIGFRVCRGAPIEPLRAAPLNTGTLKR
jgi:formylglycine-generating enzyme required for sulfatase activity